MSFFKNDIVLLGLQRYVDSKIWNDIPSEINSGGQVCKNNFVTNTWQKKVTKLL